MEEIRKKNTADLKKYIAEKREELRSLRFSSSGSGMRDTSSMQRVRKEIARSLTELRKRAGEEAAAKQA